MPELSIIIPTLNEAGYIKSCIDSIQINARQIGDIEIIVVDAGSNDKTVDLIPRDVKVLVKPDYEGYKYKSLNAGAALATGETFLFLDADTLLPEGFDQLVRQALGRTNTVGGAFEFAFDKSSFLLRLIELTNRFRYRIRQSYYGDQALFVMRKSFYDAGGFPQQRLMETAYLCKALRRLGKLRLITTNIITSSRRFEKGGILRVYLFDMMIWIRNILGLEIQQYAEKYWRQETY